MPCILILHKILLPLLHYLAQQRGDERLLTELTNRGEEGVEVEDDTSGEWEASERLPVDAEVDAVQSKLGGLEVAVFFVGVARGHVEGLVDF